MEIIQYSHYRKFTSQPQHVLAYNVPAVFETGPIIKRNIKLAGTVAKLAMRQPFVLFKGLTFQKLCL
ncbi:hypothetical protein, partial [Escherichia coli]|uniref:hypothetical protein n=1 Tax=Escherichia coli TaxID=562 RepID=UPI001BFC9E19